MTITHKHYSGLKILYVNPSCISLKSKVLNLRTQWLERNLIFHLVYTFIMVFSFVLVYRNGKKATNKFSNIKNLLVVVLLTLC